MFSDLKMYLSALYVLLRGPFKVITVPTPLLYRKRHPKEGSKGALVSSKWFQIRCQQFKHETVFEHWFVPNRTDYTYSVHVSLMLNDDEVIRLPVGHYPHLCHKWFVKSFYPHVCAVEAYMDSILHLDEVQELLQGV